MGPVLAGRAGTLAVVAVYAVLAAGAAARPSWLFDRVDGPIERFVTEHRTAWLDEVMRTVTHAGATPVALVAGAVLAAAAWSRSGHVAGLVIAVTAACPLVQALLKAAVDRERPALAPMVHTTSSSFPSGHAMTATALWALVPTVWSLWSTASARPTSARRLVAGAAWFVIAAVAVSRVYLGVHWASDVVGGVLAGVALVGVLATVVRPARGSGGASPPPC